MSTADIPFAISITNLEGWGYVERDFRRMLHLDPRGCLKATVGGKKVGITTATSYGRLGWIGNVVVLLDYRGKGIGGELVNRAVSYLSQEGAETMRLNSYPRSRHFYEEMGFRSEFENIRFTGFIAPGDQPAATAVVNDPEQVASFDERFFGASRQRLLRALARDFQETFISAHNGKLRGYLVGQVGRSSCEIAPWVVDPRARGVERELWGALSRAVGRTSVAFTAPVLSKRALAVANWIGLERSFKTIRMYLGRHTHGGIPEGIIGLGGLEKG